MDEEDYGLPCPPLDFGFGDFDSFLAGIDDDGACLDGFLDNVEVDDVGEARIVAPEKIKNDENLRNPNCDLGVKQRSGIKIKIKMHPYPEVIENPPVRHGIGKQLRTGPVPETMENPPVRHGIGKQLRTDPETMEKPRVRHGIGKQFKIVQAALDPNYQPTNEVVPSATSPVSDPSIELSGFPKVESTRIASSSKAVIDFPVSGNTNQSVPRVESTITGIDYEKKLEVSKRKLQESYGAAQQAKRQRQIAVLDFHPGSENSRVQQRSCQGRFKSKKLQRLYTELNLFTAVCEYSSVLHRVCH